MMANQDFAGTQVVETVEDLWGVPLQPAGCAQCGQAHLIAASRMGMTCPYCGREKLASQPAQLRKEPPEKLVPFLKERSHLSAIFSGFVKDVWLRPDDLNVDKLLERAVPVFWPMWLVDCEVLGTWEAEIGFDYQVKSSKEFYSGASWQSREILEDRVRWEARLGGVKRHHDNIATPALEGHQALLKLVGRYDFKRAVDYDPPLVEDAALRIPDLQMESAWPLAQVRLDRIIAGECRRAAAGQHIRNFSARMDYGGLNWTQLLLPLYFTYYTDDDGVPHPLFINGQTGAVGGLRLASQCKGWKWAGITAAVAFAAFLISLLCFALSALLPPAAVLGVGLAVLSLLIGAGAIVPAVWPWQWNRKQQDGKVIIS